MSANIPKSMVEDPVLGDSGRAASIGSLEGIFSTIVFSWRMFSYRTICYFLSHLGLLRFVFDLLRVVRPVSLFAKTLVVTKATEVREVLGRFDDFFLSEFIEPGMPWGRFIMTIDGREQHDLERGLLQQAVNPSADVEAIRGIARKVCNAAIQRAASGRLDVVTELAEPVMVEIFKEYFGIPPVGGSQGMRQVMRDLAGIIMVNPPVGSRPWMESRKNIDLLTAQLRAQIGTRKANGAAPQGSPTPSDFLTRLVNLHNASSPAWFGEDWIRRYLTGLVATGAATVVRGTTHAVDQLLAHPECLPRARTLASELDQSEENLCKCVSPELSPEQTRFKCDLENSRRGLLQLVYEALRFRPMLPLLIRDCPRDTVVAKGRRQARLVPGGTRVIASPLAAMFDPEAFPDPSRFAERPLADYLHFGIGPRECFGRYIAETVMIEIVRALLRLPNLARAGGTTGRVRYQGPVPCSLILTC
jgi:cytochrome P450